MHGEKLSQTWRERKDQRYRKGKQAEAIFSSQGTHIVIAEALTLFKDETEQQMERWRAVREDLPSRATIRRCRPRWRHGTGYDEWSQTSEERQAT